LEVAGLMSGTSLDGLTIAQISIEESRSHSTEALKRICREAKLHSGITYPFPRDLRAALSALAEPGNRITTGVLAAAGKRFGDFAAKSFEQFLTRKSKVPHVDLIGFHGQTVYHEPNSKLGTITFQIGDPSPLCFAAGVPVVSDFRTMDTAAGGQGAPLVPIVDYLRYGSADISRIVLNIGGISNLTLIPRNCKLKNVRAFDIGPGNMLIDGAVKKLTNSRKEFDEGGKIASNGRSSEKLLEFIKREDDFRFLEFPKSTGRERYSRPFLEKILSRAKSLGLSLEDIVSTISTYTVFMIDYHIREIVEMQSERVDEIIVGGGGTKNKFLLRELSRVRPETKISSHDTYGVPARCWESFAFSVIAYLSYHMITGNVPTATGAVRPVVLGRINYPSNNAIM